MVTLYHWDLPQALNDTDGWLNRTVADNFADYAELCFTEFGDRVKFWITLNEPWVIAWQGYGDGTKAPGVQGPGHEVYTAGHNLLLSHSKAYHVYNNKFRSAQRGTIGITLNIHWAVPKEPDSPADVDAAERSLQFALGWFARPVVEGDYPDVMRWTVGNKSQQLNLTTSRLPTFTDEERRLLKGSQDFLGINFYTSEWISGERQPLTPPSYFTDQDLRMEKNPTWKGSGSSWLKVTPFGLRKILNWIRNEYSNPPVYITENGVSDRSEELQDDDRVAYLRDYINELLKAVRVDGCDVRGYTAWSLMDNFEWDKGYEERFGLHYVNFTDPARPRVPKLSAHYYRQLIEDNGEIVDLPGLVCPCGPENNTVSAGPVFSYDCQGHYNINRQNGLALCDEDSVEGRALSCGEPVCIEQARVLDGNSTTELPALVYSCYLPYDGNSLTVIRQCTSHGDPLICDLSDVDCSQPPAIQNTIVSVAETTLGERATYSCIPGYKGFHSGDVTCLVTGTWSNLDLICKVNCTQDQFECLDGECTFAYWVCDGDIDCTDGSDENHCPDIPCKADEFQCLDGECISESWVCDTRDDCTGGEDEDQNCEP
ncbi:hypothetical protein ScPMuIL_006844 [Solemya velum]